MNKLMFVLCLIAIGCGSEEIIEPEVESVPHKESINNVEDEKKELTIEETRKIYPEITFENVDQLGPGIYRFTPTAVVSTGNPPDERIAELIWGNVDWVGHTVKGIDFPEDVPKIRVTIHLRPLPYYENRFGVPVIAHEPGTWIPTDEVLVHITKTIEKTQEEGGERGNRFKFISARYNGRVLRNLTNPDRIFEYE